MTEVHEMPLPTRDEVVYAINEVGDALEVLYTKLKHARILHEQLTWGEEVCDEDTKPTLDSIKREAKWHATFLTSEISARGVALFDCDDFDSVWRAHPHWQRYQDHLALEAAKKKAERAQLKAELAAKEASHLEAA